MPSAQRTALRRRLIPPDIPELPDGINTIPNPPQLPANTLLANPPVPPVPNILKQGQPTPPQTPTPKTPGQEIPKPVEPLGTQGEIDLGDGFTEEMLQPVYRKPTEIDFREPPKLEEVLDLDPDFTKEDMAKTLPKQVDVNKLLEQLRYKILRQVALPLTLRDLKGAYLSSPHFRDIYLYLSQGKMPTNKKKVTATVSSPSYFFLLDDLLFR